MSLTRPSRSCIHQSSCFASPRPTAVAWLAMRRAPRQACIARAKENEESALTGIVAEGEKLVDKVVDFVPSSVPRAAAKVGVTFIGAAIIFGLIQKVISGVVTLLVLGGLAYYYLTKDSGGDDDGDSKPSKKSAASDDMDDPLSDAQRIMDKYR